MKSNSFNEWDPLLEVIVGSVLGAQEMAFEEALGAYFEPGAVNRDFKGGQRSQVEISEAQCQLDALAEFLESKGVHVKRPALFPEQSRVQTPDFVVPFGNSYACPRDVLFVSGDLIVEASMAQRGRFFEYRGYRKILLDHFESGGRWLSVPKPLLDEESFEKDFTTKFEPYHPEHHPVLKTRDPCFDAASFARCGRDIFWQPDMVSNANGARWLQDVLGSDYRVHRVEFNDRYPQHIDTTLVPLRPGLVMINPERKPKPGSLELFEKNNWEIVTPPASVRKGLPAPSRDISNWISMNVLMIDPETVIIEAAEEPLSDFFKHNGFDVVGIPFDKVYKFGGGFHCCTVDLRRDGTLQSYFDEF